MYSLRWCFSPARTHFVFEPRDNPNTHHIGPLSFDWQKYNSISKSSNQSHVIRIQKMYVVFAFAWIRHTKWFGERERSLAKLLFSILNWKCIIKTTLIEAHRVHVSFLSVPFCCHCRSILFLFLISVSCLNYRYRYIPKAEINMHT